MHTTPRPPAASTCMRCGQPPAIATCMRCGQPKDMGGKCSAGCDK